MLGRMLFSGDDGGKPTATLSGGEGARLMLCEAHPAGAQRARAR
jgi:ATPase subunit of ABC transporter with duplicated ATPase domains